MITTVDPMTFYNENKKTLEYNSSQSYFDNLAQINNEVSQLESLIFRNPLDKTEVMKLSTMSTTSENGTQIENAYIQSRGRKYLDKRQKELLKYLPDIQLTFNDKYELANLDKGINNV